MSERIKPVAGMLFVNMPAKRDGENGRGVRATVAVAPPRSKYHRGQHVVVAPYAGLPYGTGYLVPEKEVLATVESK